jgi:hypothetical protein
MVGSRAKDSSLDRSTGVLGFPEWQGKTGAFAQCSKGGSDASRELKPGKIKGYVSAFRGATCKMRDFGYLTQPLFRKYSYHRTKAQRHDSNLNIHFPKRMSSSFTSLNTTSRSLFTANMKETLPDPT